MSTIAAKPATASLAWGLLATFTLALIATFAARFVPLIGAPVLAIVFGVFVRSVVALPENLKPGIRFSAKKILQGAIIVSGFGL